MVGNVCRDTANGFNNARWVCSAGHRGGIEIKMLVDMTAANDDKPLRSHRDPPKFERRKRQCTCLQPEHDAVTNRHQL
jgi:hypothetical protein